MKTPRKVEIKIPEGWKIINPRDCKRGDLIAAGSFSERAWVNKSSWFGKVSKNNIVIRRVKPKAKAEMHVSDFTPASDFDESLFESQIGKFPHALTGEMDAATALDEYRS